jgi:hypothetical protein
MSVTSILSPKQLQKVVDYCISQICGEGDVMKDGVLVCECVVHCFMHEEAFREGADAIMTLQEAYNEEDHTQEEYLAQIDLTTIKLLTLDPEAVL